MGQEEYDNWSMNKPIHEINNLNAHELNFIEKDLIRKANAKKILDIGCGNGKRLFSFLSQKNISYVGVEKFERFAKDSIYKEKIIIADIVELDISDFNTELKDVDTVTILGGSLGGVFGFENQKTAWKKILDVLPVNGNIIFDSFIVDGFENDEEIGERILYPEITPPQFFLSQSQLNKIWTDLKIEILEQTDFTPGPILRYYRLKKTE
jgi:SAM-dependent methyltransferase